MLPFSFCLALAQLDQGQIAGRVTDPGRDAVAAAKVSVISAQTGRRIDANTSTDGSFVAPNLPVGAYSLEIEATGFRKFVRENIKVDAATRTTVDAQLTIGSLSETVTVTDTAPALQDATAQLGRVVEARQISDLALNGRNPVNLALIKAGVVGSNFNAFNPTGLGAGLSINGGQQDGNLFTIDGVGAVRTRGDGQSGPALLGIFNADSLQEVQILTSSYPAEYGRAADGQVRFVTKSGSRDFHGTAWHFLRNSALDANSWVRNASRTFDATRPAPFRFNQPGFSIGGPVYIPGRFNAKREKLFFFVAEEWISFRQEKTGSAIVPSAAMRTGNFNELLNAANPFFRRSIALRDPLAAGTTPFPDNIIPAQRLSRNGMGLLRAYPLPVAGFQQGAANWIDSQPNPRDIRKDTVRIDYLLGRHRVSFAGTNFYFAEDDPFRGSFTVANTRWRRPNQTGSLSVSSTLSSRIVNEFTATAANDVVQMTLYPFNGVNRYERSLYGIDFGYLIPGPKRIENRIPTIDITGFTSLDGSSKPGTSSGPMVSFSDNLTWIQGAHTFKTGFFFGRDTQINADQIAFNQNGWFTFRDVGNPATTGNALGNAALGNFDTYFEIGPAADTHARSNAYEWFAQDTWRLHQNVTLELGVRYSYFAPWTAKWNDFSNFDPRFFTTRDRATLDPRTGAIVAGDPYNGIVQGGTSYPESARGRALGAFVPNVQRLFRGAPEGFVNKYFFNFSPRFGLAWRATPKTVLRLGGGSFKARDFLNNGSLFRNAPNQDRVDVVNGVADSPGGRGGSQFPFSLGALALEYNYPTAYHYSFSLQRELPFGVVLEAAYVGKTSVDLYRVRNLNQLARPGTVQANPGINVNALRPFYGLAIINYSEQSGRSLYNSAQVSLDRRFRNGLGFGMAYTFSKNIDNVATPYDAYNIQRALSTNDRPHLLSVNYIYQLPFLRNNQTLLGNVLGNWQISGVTFFRSGVPLSVTDGNDVAGVGPGSAAQTWNLTGDPTRTGAVGVGQPWFQGPAFTVPAPGTFGNAGLNILRGPSFRSFDIALFKNFRIAERLAAQLRGEAFNFPNHPLLSNPTTNPRSGDFSRITSKVGERNLQLGLKLIF